MYIVYKKVNYILNFCASFKFNITIKIRI